MGAGQASFLSLDYDYGIGDYPLTDAQSSGAHRPILQIPFVLSSTSIFYNITGNPKLKLNPSVLAQVLQGNITTWDDPAIIKLNPTLSYVSQNCLPVWSSCMFLPICMGLQSSMGWPLDPPMLS